MVRQQRKSAFSVAMREAQTQNRETVPPQERDTVGQQDSETASLPYRETPERLYSNTVTRQESKTVSQYEKVSFYITPEQEMKLDDLAHDFRRAHGKRINRNDIIRYLLDQVTLESLEDMK